MDITQANRYLDYLEAMQNHICHSPTPEPDEGDEEELESEEDDLITMRKGDLFQAPDGSVLIRKFVSLSIPYVVSRRFFDLGCASSC